MNAIEIKNVSVSYVKNVEVLNNISFDVKEGEILGIVGPNGGGKSTLMKAILGLVPLESGSITIHKDYTVAYVPQFSTMKRDFPISTLEVVLSAFLHGGWHPFKRFSKVQINEAKACLAKVGLEGLENRQIGELSGGECQKLLIARALASKANILLLDEPTASVDPTSRENLYELILNLPSKGLTVIWVTHDSMAITSKLKHIAYINQRLVSIT